MRRPGHNQGTQHADVSAVQSVPGEDLVLALGESRGDPRDPTGDVIGVNRQAGLQS